MTHNCYNLLKPCLFTYSFTAPTLKIWEGHASSWVTLLSNSTNNNRKRRATWAYYPPQCSIAIFGHLENWDFGSCFNILKPSGRHSCLGGYKPFIHLWEKKNPQQHKLFSLGVLLRSCLWAEHIECEPSAAVALSEGLSVSVCNRNVKVFLLQLDCRAKNWNPSLNL